MTEMSDVFHLHHQQQMIDLLNAALEADGLTQAELAKRTGHTPKHINQVLTGRKTASPGALDYWAFVLGREWHVELCAPGSEKEAIGDR